jgi:hypothetical protein
MPAEVELVCKLPDHFEGKQEFLAELERRIAEVEQQCAHERMRTGRRVVGRRNILRQSWRDSPTSRESRRNLNPRVAARDSVVRVAVLQRNKLWLTRYRHARQQWLAGFDVQFPFGTYWLRRHARVSVEPPPTPTITN